MIKWSPEEVIKRWDAALNQGGGEAGRAGLIESLLNKVKGEQPAMTTQKAVKPPIVRSQQETK